jgi:hypothetical protein
MLSGILVEEVSVTRERACHIVALGVLLLMPTVLMAAGTQPKRTRELVVYYRFEGGFSPYRYWEMAVVGNRLTFAMEYCKQTARVKLTLTDGEQLCLRHLVAPLLDLASRPISREAEDAGKSMLRLQEGRKQVELRWVHTQEPSLLAFVRFAERLANRERCLLLLSSDDPEVVYAGTHEVLSNIERIFRPADLRPILWQVVERWPLPRLGGLHNRSTLANAVTALGDLEPREEWAGRIRQAIERLSRDNQLFAMISLSPYVVTKYHEGTPWFELTPLFVSQLELARATPDAKRNWREKQAIVDLQSALRALNDPRAKAALSVAPE